MLLSFSSVDALLCQKMVRRPHVTQSQNIWFGLPTIKYSSNCTSDWMGMTVLGESTCTFSLCSHLQTISLHKASLNLFYCVRMKIWVSKYSVNTDTHFDGLATASLLVVTGYSWPKLFWFHDTQGIVKPIRSLHYSYMYSHLHHSSLIEFQF